MTGSKEKPRSTTQIEGFDKVYLILDTEKHGRWTLHCGDKRPERFGWYILRWEGEGQSTLLLVSFALVLQDSFRDWEFPVVDKVRGALGI